MRFLLLALLLWLASSPLGAQSEAPYDRGLRLYNQGDYQGALEAFLSGPKGAEATQWAGWCYLKLDQLPRARVAFEQALEVEPDHTEARTGLGYLELREQHPDRAAREFQRVLQTHPDHADARAGLALALARQEEVPEAPYPARRPPAPQAEVPFRAGAQYFERHGPSGWEPILVQGINLGPTLPGRFAGQPPQERQLYAGWLRQMADMGCNVVRVYTILPPGFYQAFWDYHQDPQNPPLWLVQGVWTELPVLDDYLAEDFEGNFRAEIRSVVDVLHGQADLDRRPGHAWGSYTADVSPWVLAHLLGREFEPHSVLGFNRLHPGLTWKGRYLQCLHGSPMEAWLARMCEEMVAYEMQQYRTQRPISFSNWPTLDPIRHPSETTRAQEAGWMAERGEFDPRVTREYDNDAMSVCVTSFQGTSAFPAGLYASYHAYPYYPEFMLHDPAYAQARSHYLGYLLQLKGHYQGMPLLIAEYGVPSSRGDAHVQPEGFDHGGHSEAGQGLTDVRLTQEIVEAGCAGGILFAWMDEWFKKNWMVVDMEIPLERNQMWFNSLDAEQNFGVIAARPGPGPGPRLSGQSGWNGPPWLHHEGLFQDLYLDADEGFFYLRLDLAHPPDLSTTRFLIGLDTYDPERGARTIPGLPPLEEGLEYLIELGPEGGRLLVEEGYAPFGIVRYYGTGEEAMAYRTEVASRDGAFGPWRAEPNRRRLDPSGKVFPSVRREWGLLKRGSLDPGRSDWDSLADWNLVGSRLELRLPWALLGFSDPSSHRVLHNVWEDRTLGTRETAGIRVLAAAVGPGGQLLDSLPGLSAAGKLQTARPYLWPAWEKPRYHLEPKASYGAMRELFLRWGGRPQ